MFPKQNIISPLRWSLYWVNYLEEPVILTALHLLHCRRLEYNDPVLLLSNTEEETIHAVIRYDEDNCTPLEECTVRYTMPQSLTSGMLVLHYLYQRIYQTDKPVEAGTPLVQVLGEPKAVQSLLNEWTTYLPFGRLGLDRYFATAPATCYHLQNYAESVEFLLIHNPDAMWDWFPAKGKTQCIRAKKPPRKILLLAPIPSEAQYQDALIGYEHIFRCLFYKQSDILIGGTLLNFRSQRLPLFSRSNSYHTFLEQFDPRPPAGYDMDILHFINCMEQQPDQLEQLIWETVQQENLLLQNALLQAGLSEDDPLVQAYVVPPDPNQEVVYELDTILSLKKICSSAWYKLYSNRAILQMQRRCSFWDILEKCDRETAFLFFNSKILDAYTMFGYQSNAASTSFDPEEPLEEQLETASQVQFYPDPLQDWYLAHLSTHSELESEEYFHSYLCFLRHLPIVQFFEQFRRNLLAQIVGRGNKCKTKFRSDPLWVAWVQSVQAPIYSNFLREYLQNLLHNRSPEEVSAEELFHFTVEGDAINVTPWLQLVYASLGKKLFCYYVTDDRGLLRANNAYLVKPKRTASSTFVTETAEEIWNCLPRKNTSSHS